MNIGKKIKQLRTRKQMTQSELAGDRVSRNMLSLIENGRAVPSVQTLEAFAEKLKVSCAFLLSEGEEEKALLKQSQMKDIRHAYSVKNYRIAADLCRKLYQNGMAQDDEVDLILAESLFETAKEILVSDRVREACLAFDEAVLYAQRTAYFADHLIGAASVYFDYLSTLSPSLMSENLDTEPGPHMRGALSGRDLFCRYILAVTEEKTAFTVLPTDPAYASLLNAHVRAVQHMNEGDFDKAVDALSEILHGEDLLPGIFMYHVFGDMEECCRRVGNGKNAELYRDLRMSQFEKLLS